MELKSVDQIHKHFNKYGSISSECLSAIAFYYLQLVPNHEYKIADLHLKRLVYDGYREYLIAGGWLKEGDRYFDSNFYNQIILDRHAYPVYVCEDDLYFIYRNSEENKIHLQYLGPAYIVVGDHGPYYEFIPGSIDKQFEQYMVVPNRQQWRLQEKYDSCKYIHKDYRGIKVYHQKATVDYAPYKPGRYYVSLLEEKIPAPCFL